MLAGVALVGILAIVGILALGRRVVPVFHGGLLVVLTGYAFFGKGFAYLGFPPLYIGEIVLGLCLASILWTAGRAKFSPLHALLILFMAWGAIRTIPYVATDGIDALRDAATWVYGFFAIGVSITVRPEHLGHLARGYRRFIPLFLVWLPIAAGLTFVSSGLVPNTPGSNVPLVVYKAGDMSVQLAGIGAFLLLGIYHELGETSALRELAIWSLWLAGAGIAAALNRAAIIAMSAIAAVVLFVRASGRWISLLAVTALLVLLATFLDPTVDVGGPRSVSVDQVIQNLTSVFSSQPGTVNQATKEWRERWWNTIVNYTVNGPYFWVGKGFGVNLADADGFQVLADDSLRAPHSTHLEILARAGVPGLVLWLTLQGAFAIGLLRAGWRSYRSAPAWLPVLGWVFVYWLAAIIDGSFDVYLGGPQGGIWFWSVIGLGIAAIRLSREEPELDLGGDEVRRAEADAAPRAVGLSPVFAMAGGRSASSPIGSPRVAASETSGVQGSGGEASTTATAPPALVPLPAPVGSPSPAHVPRAAPPPVDPPPDVDERTGPQADAVDAAATARDGNYGAPAGPAARRPKSTRASTRKTAATKATTNPKVSSGPKPTSSVESEAGSKPTSSAESGTGGSKSATGGSKPDTGGSKTPPTRRAPRRTKADPPASCDS
jgi:hypothetical protein